MRSLLFRFIDLFYVIAATVRITRWQIRRRRHFGGNLFFGQPWSARPAVMMVFLTTKDGRWKYATQKEHGDVWRPWAWRWMLLLSRSYLITSTGPWAGGKRWPLPSDWKTSSSWLTRLLPHFNNEIGSGMETQTLWCAGFRRGTSYRFKSKGSRLSARLIDNYFCFIFNYSSDVFFLSDFHRGNLISTRS